MPWHRGSRLSTLFIGPVNPSRCSLGRVRLGLTRSGVTLHQLCLLPAPFGVAAVPSRFSTYLGPERLTVKV